MILVLSLNHTVQRIREGGVEGRGGGEWGSDGDSLVVCTKGGETVGGGLSSLELQVSLLYTFSHENLTEHSRSSMGFRRLPWASMMFHGYHRIM